MATLKSPSGAVELPDGSPIKKAAEELGVPFGCEEGRCRTCEITVLEGQENLAPMNEQEKTHDLEQGHRLCCQAKIKKGSVTIDF